MVPPDAAAARFDRHTVVATVTLAKHCSLDWEVHERLLDDPCLPAVFSVLVEDLHTSSTPRALDEAPPVSIYPLVAVKFVFERSGGLQLAVSLACPVAQDDETKEKPF